MKNFPNEISMRQASIFELRTLARNMGVNSPTTYKKDQLINKMLKIINGDEKPEVPKSRAGRPPKKIISASYNNNNSCNIFNENDDCEKSQNLNKYDFSDVTTNKFSVLASPNAYDYECESINSSFDFESRQGYLQVLEDKTCFIFEYGNVASVENVVNIGPQKVSELFLRNGDLIKVLCKKDGVSGNRYFAEIEEFENQKFTSSSQLENRPHFENLKIDYKQENKIVFDRSNNQSNCLNLINDAVCGSRNIIMCKNLRMYKDFVLNFKSLNKPCSIVNICLEVLPEEEGFIQNTANFESFYTSYGDYEKQNNHTIALAIDRIKRLAEHGKNVIVFINEVGKLIKYKNFALGLEPQQLKYKSFDNVSKLLSLARKFENGNAITVFALLKEDKNNINFSQILNELDNMNCNIYQS